ncbi:hypothetical protein [Asticcacaulis endophyticus]|uniref:GIY-YIG domain-containing protein n=1 Tax=Asticcacaulis endophyticus TaxID=1395890 RepID=A0A918UTI9_9CAUL|nr:hypothetical protein [Asticcacaulis endophyticus]GGZ32139.1 hypothetical protein GCM10011273_17760 [Asticcacaulis endophyticus]
MIEIKYNWEPISNISLSLDGKPTFGDLSSLQLAGIYKFDLTCTQLGPCIYIGESKNIKNRWGNYRLGAAQTAYKVHHVLKSVLRRQGVGAAHRMIDLELKIHGITRDVKLEDKDFRLLFETSAIEDARSQGLIVLSRQTLIDRLLEYDVLDGGEVT